MRVELCQACATDRGKWPFWAIQQIVSTMSWADCLPEIKR